MIMMTRIEYLLIGFFFIAFLKYVYLNIRHTYMNFSSDPGYRLLTSASRSELTDVETELVNVIAFTELCSACLTEDAYRSLQAHELRTDVDREALNTLVSLGICQEQAQFICNYFLAQNLEYPGDLIVLSSQTPLYTYSHDYIPSPNRIRLQIYELWGREYHEIIREKKVIYYFDK
jgi:hypothetical protein